MVVVMAVPSLATPVLAGGCRCGVGRAGGCGAVCPHAGGAWTRWHPCGRTAMPRSLHPTAQPHAAFGTLCAHSRTHTHPLARSRPPRCTRGLSLHGCQSHAGGGRGLAVPRRSQRGLCLSGNSSLLCHPPASKSVPTAAFVHPEIAAALLVGSSRARELRRAHGGPRSHIPSPSVPLLAASIEVDAVSWISSVPTNPGGQDLPGLRGVGRGWVPHTGHAR